MEPELVDECLIALERQLVDEYFIALELELELVLFHSGSLALLYNNIFVSPKAAQDNCLTATLTFIASAIVLEVKLNR